VVLKETAIPHHPVLDLAMDLLYREQKVAKGPVGGLANQMTWLQRYPEPVKCAVETGRYANLVHLPL
jgi:hypothetical protein